MITNPVIECLMNHKSIRNFEEREIPQEVIETLLSAGVRAANGSNLQRYSLIVVDKKEIKEKLTVYDKFNKLLDVPLIIISIIDNYRLKKWFDINNAQYLCLDGPIDFFLPFYDAVIALHNISIAAESLGLGAYYDGNVLTYDLKELFNAPDYTFPVGMLCVGYPKKQPKISDRLPIDAVLHHNTYRMPEDEDIKEWYREKEYLFKTKNSEERLEELAKKGVHNLAQAYCDYKFSQPDKTVERSNKIIQNIEKGKFKLL